MPGVIESAESRREPLVALMCSPDHFNIVDVKNIHMKGNEGKVDEALFKTQWQSIYDAFHSELNNGNLQGLEVIQGVPGCEDMVFCANQSFPWLDENDKPLVIMSRMRYPSRQNEV